LAFYARDFIYDSIPSENFNLVILNFDTGGTEDSSPGAETTIYKDWIYRKPKPYFYGRSNITPRTMTLTVGAKDPLTGLDRSAIDRWLLNRSTYKKFQVCQDDIYPFYWNVLFTSSQIKYVGNVQRGITLVGECDSAFATSFPKYVKYNFGGNLIKDFDFPLYVDSDDDNYIYPKVTFTLNSIGNSLSLKNYTDANREFLFSNLQPNETIVVDNYLRTVVSSTGLLRLNDFNLQWFRLLRGINNLHLNSGIGTLEIEYQTRKII
jgi:hypothetical protein